MTQIRRAAQTGVAFVRMGYLLDFSYPLAFFVTQLHTMLPVFIYFFVDRLVTEGRNVGGDYFSFVMIGMLSARVLLAGLSDISGQLDEALQQGRFETLLVEPIRWKLLPFWLVQWPLVMRLLTTALMIGLTIPMGATYRWEGVPMALLITTLGVFATLAVGTLAMSVKVLSKRSDPIVAVYLVATQVLSGAFYPLNVLPGPLRALSWLLPQTYVMAGNRAVLQHEPAGLYGPSGIEAVVALALGSVVLFAFALWVFGRSMNYARRIGVLGGY